MTRPSESVASSVISGDDRARGLTHTRSAATPTRPGSRIDAREATASSSGGIRARRGRLELLVLQPGQGALARGVLRVLPEHPLAILAHVLGDERDGVLAVIGELHGPADGGGGL